MIWLVFRVFRHCVGYRHFGGLCGFILLLSSFGIGQVLPLLLAGTFAASVPKLLAMRSVGQWVPPISGVVLLTSGVVTLLARWT